VVAAIADALPPGEDPFQMPSKENSNNSFAASPSCLWLPDVSHFLAMQNLHLVLETKLAEIDFFDF
jgi:hypothetical protein